MPVCEARVHFDDVDMARFDDRGAMDAEFRMAIVGLLTAGRPSRAGTRS